MKIHPSLPAICFCMGLSACAQPDIRLETQIVEKPVAIACIAPADIPARPSGLGTAPDNQGAALSLALAKLLEWRAWGMATSAVLEACSDLSDS